MKVYLQNWYIIDESNPYKIQIFIRKCSNLYIQTLENGKVNVERFFIKINSSTNKNKKKIKHHYSTSSMTFFRPQICSWDEVTWRLEIGIGRNHDITGPAAARGLLEWLSLHVETSWQWICPCSLVFPSFGLKI